MIELVGLGFSYGGLPVVSGLDAVFEAGSMTAVTGRSGSGKSTLLYLLGLMLTPASGEVRVDGAATTTLGDAARADLRARHMGFVFQDAMLDPARSVLDNVLEGALYSGRRAGGRHDAARDLLDRFGVDVDPRRRPGQISGGQAQRVALCRALIGRPAIVLADEPSGNLDEASAEVVWSALRSAADDGAVVVVATHDTRRSTVCDHVLEVRRAVAA